jgi:hypothetical protein
VHLISTHSLQCEHILCNSCLPRIAKRGVVEETLKCPTCRQETLREEIQLVHYTADTQWDKLLEIAQAWGRIDKRGEEETSEEEAEEGFLDDNGGDAG